MTEPIACSLSPDAYADRASEIADLARRALLARSPLPGGGARLRFAAGPGVEAELDAIVAAEARCCPFLRLELRHAAGALELDVTGPPEAEPLIAELFA
jgi:hypothetical protein